MYGYSFKQKKFVKFNRFSNVPLIVGKTLYSTYSDKHMFNGLSCLKSSICELYISNSDFKNILFILDDYNLKSFYIFFIKIGKIYINLIKNPYFVYSLDSKNKDFTFYLKYYSKEELLKYILNEQSISRSNILNILKKIGPYLKCNFFYLKFKINDKGMITKSLVIDIYNINYDFDFECFINLINKNFIFNLNISLKQDLKKIYIINTKRIELSISLENSRLENIYFFSNNGE